MDLYLILEWVGDAWNELAIVDEEKIKTIESDIKEYLENELDINVKTTSSSPQGNSGWEYEFSSHDGGEYKFFSQKMELNKIG